MNKRTFQGLAVCGDDDPHRAAASDRRRIRSLAIGNISQLGNPTCARSARMVPLEMLAFATRRPFWATNVLVNSKIRWSLPSHTRVFGSIRAFALRIPPAHTRFL